MRVGLVALLGVMSIPALLTASRTWVPVEATVLESRIEAGRPGNLAWTLEVDLRYEVDGERYERRELDLFDDGDRGLVQTRMQEWPVGRVLTVYHDRAQPERVSLDADGGLEAIVVVTVLAAGALLATLTPFLIAMRRRNASGATISAGGDCSPS